MKITFVYGEAWIYTDTSGTVGPASYNEAISLPLKDANLIPDSIRIRGEAYTKEEFIRNRDKSCFRS